MPTRATAGALVPDTRNTMHALRVRQAVQARNRGGFLPSQGAAMLRGIKEPKRKGKV